MRPVALISLILVAVVAIAACRSARARSPVIAKVNGQAVHRAEFERFLALKMGELTNAELPDVLLSQMLDEYIVRLLILSEAARAGLTVSDAEIEQIAIANPEVKFAGATDDARKEFANDLLVAKYYRQILLKDVRVSSEEARAYLEQNRERLADKPSYYVREIRVDRREEAERLRREVAQEHRDFAEVARQHSQASNAEQGGLARYHEGELPSALEKAIKPLRPGDISPVVQSSFGFHIFKLERRVQPRPSGPHHPQLDERKSQLIEELIERKNQQVVDEAIERLLSSANIEINYQALGFTYAGRLRHN
jgi:parvulin-like peptidyl-prolyl isomerase